MENKSQIVNTLLYISDEGAVSIDVIIDQENETMWATQKTMAELFNVNVPAISKHLKNIFEDNELEKNSVISKMEITASDGKKYKTNFYNLDAIISVGYRVNSKNATNFRIWATSILKDYIIKGFALDDELLKKGTRFGKDYFENLLERIRAIRSSERKFNQKITDIYITSFDYNKNAELTKEFFATVQNKLIYAVSGHTAAELIATRCDSNKENMGLTSWKNQNDKILMSDVVISKNYLTKDELLILNNLVDGFLTLAETRARNQIPMRMADWKNILDAYINLNQLPELMDKGNISSDDAKKIAQEEYEKFKVIQEKTFESDLDKFIKEIKRIERNA